MGFQNLSSTSAIRSISGAVIAQGRNKALTLSGSSVLPAYPGFICKQKDFKKPQRQGLTIQHITHCDICAAEWLMVQNNILLFKYESCFLGSDCIQNTFPLSGNNRKNRNIDPVEFICDKGWNHKMTFLQKLGFDFYQSSPMLLPETIL